MKTENGFIWKKCKRCGFLQHETHLRCLHCKFNQFEKIEASGDGRLISYTILTAPPAEYRNKFSYALGVVEFKNGIKALGQITTSENLNLGMKLRPIYKKVCENLDNKEVYSYVFEPI